MCNLAGVAHAHETFAPIQTTTFESFMPQFQELVLVLV